MERVSTRFCERLKRYWKRRQYQRLDSAISTGKNMKKARFGGEQRRSWKIIRGTVKLRVKVVSPVRLLGRIRDVYVGTMVKLSRKPGDVNGGNDFKQKIRSPKARQSCMVSSSGEVFDSRLVFHIYTTLMACRELAAY